MKLLLIALLLFPLAAAAETAVDMTVVLRTDRGEVMKDPTGRTEDDKDCVKCAPLTLGHAIAAALNGLYDDEKSLDFQRRFDRGALAARIRDSKEAVLSAGEVALIEKLVAKAQFFNSMIYQIAPLIDPNLKPGPAQ